MKLDISKLTLILGVLLIPAGIVHENVAAASSTASIQVVTVTEQRIGTHVVLGGTVVPVAEVTLAAQVPGRIEFIAGHEGDWFDAGQVLVSIDHDDLLAQRRQALAAISTAGSALRNSRVQYSRELWAPESRNVGRMSGMGMPSMFDQFFTRPFASSFGSGNPWLERQTDLYSAGTGVSQAQSQYAHAQSGLDGIEAKLRDSQSLAPFTGVIVNKLVELGDSVQPGQPLMKYVDARHLQVKIDIPARLMPGLSRGMLLPAKLDVGDTRVKVKVAQIFPMADINRHTVTVKFDLPEDIPGGPGMYAEIMVPDINSPAQSIPVIPVSAIMWRGSLPAVFIVNNQNQAELRLLRLGDYVDDTNVTVLSGLYPGERIVGNPSAGMKSGETIIK